MRKASTPGFIGEKLKEAREARGLNGTALADLVGLSRQAISKYENNDGTPSPEVLENLASTLRLPVNYFLIPRKRKVDFDSAIFYRSLSAATLTERLRAEKRYLWLQDIVAYLLPLVEIPNNNLPKYDVPENPEFITDKLIEEIALDLRRQWGLGLGPISNVIWLLENNGVVVSCYSLETATLDAFSQMHYDRPYIILGTDKHSAARSRFSAAHELGHLILHSNLKMKDVRNSKTLKLVESQANRFSGAFLLPETAFADEFLVYDLDYFKLKKAKWKLSIAFFIMRAKDLGYIDEKRFLLLQRYYSRKGWKKFEPLDDEIPVEKPQLLKEAIELIVDNNIRARSDIVSRLNLNARDIEDVCGLPAGYLSPAQVIDISLRQKPKLRHNPEEPGDVIQLFGE